MEYVKGFLFITSVMVTMFLPLALAIYIDHPWPLIAFAAIVFIFCVIAAAETFK